MRIKKKYTTNRLNATDEELGEDVILPFIDFSMSSIMQERHMSEAEKELTK